MIITTYRAFWWPFCKTRLVQLQDVYDAFEERDIVVIAVAQEDQDLDSHGRFLQHFDPEPRFVIAADLERTDTRRYERTSTYLIDESGVVRQVFPQLVHHRAAWPAILNEAERILAPTRNEAAPAAPSCAPFAGPSGRWWHQGVRFARARDQEVVTGADLYGERLPEVNVDRVAPRRSETH